MSPRTTRTAALLVVGVLTLTAGCAGGPALDEKPSVGIAMPTTKQLRWVADGDNLSEQFGSLGFDVSMQYADDDADAQVQQIEEMVDQGVDALVIGAVDASALTAVLSSAREAGVSVVSYDRLIVGGADVDYYASFDNRRVGTMQANSLLEGVGVLDATGEPTGAKGPFAIELFAGSPDDNNAHVFFEGAMAVLAPYLESGVLVVPSGQTTFEKVATPGWSPETAAARMATLLGPYRAGTRLAGVLSPNDGIAQAVLPATADLGYLPVVTGQDAEIPAVQSVARGEQHSTVYKDTRQLAEVTVQMVRSLLTGAEPEVNDTSSYDNGAGVVPTFLLSPQLVTKDNYRAVLVDSGYYTAEEIG
ncbi:MAG: sugar ABC transporter substrate-binding protein [Cellulomonas sp.]|uniref:Multiple sugar-binding periplasmic receptor ChvE n=1 Tax=Cellulomonas gelida TaxID=1712 RepID=A0A4Y3KNI5_9CELL|nr:MULTISPECIES: sugar-binding protein [Cellulomonas]KMM44656.1 sugar ABC transporter substrate-binding protein [Cellulomonas sp. A375-1]MCR6649632.1 sugar ABC transporter substrate-binding protein [Cellulomonas sp.]MCR6705604.1 sugar ABC transporter substrate-binding protein [Cellulomonas sp.]GEA85969.1 multiple sugar-binding periplasmic receptor ChvE [Cellulomonas gelida]GGL16659.1 multiple sugar-binding periplasmic receptor ChvE [Cellulomonas gelida]